MTTSIPLLGVLLAALSAFPIGSAWYSPGTFLTPWMKMTGTSDADMKKNFPRAMAYIGVASLVTAYILAHFIIYSKQATGVNGVTAGLETAFWAWLGISLTTIVVGSAMESRSAWVMAIQAGNRLVTLLAMGAIIGAFLK